MPPPASMPDTIVALATPPGVGALAIIRLSGPEAGAILQACTGRSSPLIPRRATLVRVRSASGLVLDEALATYFAAPASFTGEDVVELSCHGGLLVVRRVLERLLACGARPAEPGEFSRRAFENGRLDLTQAEAVMDVISAGSDLALRAAHNQLHGVLSRRVEAAADRLISVTAHLEAYIDFPEEDIAPDTGAELLDGLNSVQSELRALLATADEGRLLREGVRTAIIGAPNVGKSSLLNCLLGYERAIVSPTAGTTRDTVEAGVTLGALRLHLIDTAGLHESTDAIERAGMERSRRAGAEADLILIVADASRPPALPELPELPAEAEGSIPTPRLLLLNKCDLPEHPGWAQFTPNTPGAPNQSNCPGAPDTLKLSNAPLRLSCRTGDGLPALTRTIENLFLHTPEESDSFTAINTRHRYALTQALEALEQAKASLLAGDAPELTDVPLRAALDALGSITGRIDTEDILTRVFSTFCLGK